MVPKAVALGAGSQEALVDTRSRPGGRRRDAIISR
jgi:hypothetical protein